MLRRTSVPMLGFFSLLLLASIASSAGLSDNYTAYELLEGYGFPAGLLPLTVKDYTLNSNGLFVLNLDGSCTVNIPDAYPVKYASKITGTISSGRLSSLTGITVKVFFVWWDITAISVSDDDLVFQVGPLSASFPISNFSENPVCEGRHLRPSEPESLASDTCSAE